MQMEAGQEGRYSYLGGRKAVTRLWEEGRYSSPGKRSLPVSEI